MNLSNRSTMEIEPDRNHGRNHGRRRLIRILAAVLCILVFAFIACITYVVLDISKIWNKDLGFDAGAITGDEYETDPDAEGLPEASFYGGSAPGLGKTEGIVDIVLIGVDNRNSSQFTGRSDVLMYLRVGHRQKGTQAGILHERYVGRDRRAQ